MVIDLAELTEFKDYRVESITLVDDGPELLAEAAATADPIGFAFLTATQCSAVRAGPRPGGRTGRLSAHLIRAETAEDAAKLAAKATARPTLTTTPCWWWTCRTAATCRSISGGWLAHPGRGAWVEHDFGRHVSAGADEWERLRPFLQPDGFPTISGPLPEDGDR